MSLLKAMGWAALVTTGIIVVVTLSVGLLYLWMALHNYLVPTFVSSLVFGCGTVALVLFTVISLVIWLGSDPKPTRK